MRLHKLKASDTTGTYLVESPVTETDIMLMARQLANLRLRRGRALTSPKEVFSHLQALLAGYEHEVFALLMLDSQHRVIAFEEVFRGTLDAASVYPREIVKIALEHNAAAMILSHFVARHKMGVLCPVFLCAVLGGQERTSWASGQNRGT
nr:JAB domain-containing protein [Pseudomonas aeruginosa]